MRSELEVAQNVRVYVGVVLCALALALPTVAHAQDGESSQQPVVSIQVQGNTHLSSDAVRSELPFREGETIAVPDDVEQARAALLESGLFRNVSLDYRSTADGVTVLVQVSENPVVQTIEITGNRNWNADQQVEVPLVGWQVPWPFVDYLLTDERAREILNNQGIKTGQVLNTNELRKALGINDRGQCQENPPSPSICAEYRDKGYTLVGFGQVQPGSTLRIQIVEAVIHDVQIQGVTGPFQDKAEELFAAIPRDRPVKRETLQRTMQQVRESIYFRPTGQQAVQFGRSPDGAPHQLTMQVRLAPRELLAQPQAIDALAFSGVTAFSESELRRRVALPEGEVSNFELLEALEPVYELYRDEGFMMATFQKESLQDGVLTLQVQEGRLSEIEIRQNGYTTARITPDQGLTRISIEDPASSEDDANAASSGDGGAASEGSADEGVEARLNRFVAQLGRWLGTRSTSDRPRTQPRIIQAQLALAPDELVNQFRLRESRRKLLQLGYFNDVSFDFQRTTDGTVKMIVQVQEKEKMGSLNGGFSVSDQGLVGNVSVSGKNLYGMGQDVSLSFNRSVTGEPSTTWNLEYTGRTLVPGTDSLSVNLYNKVNQTKASDNSGESRRQRIRRLGGEASLAVPVASDAQTEVGLRQEWVKTDTQGKPSPTRSSVTVASLTFTQDDRNNPLFATRGGQRRITLERAGLLDLGTETFTKAEGTLIQHWPTLDDQTVALRAVGKVGAELPDQEQFTIGDSRTVRGTDTLRDSQVAFANLEYRIQLLPQRASVAGFVDLGTNGEAWRKSFGVEGRVTAPYIGPVRLAIAWPVTDRVETMRANFGFGTFF